MTSQRTRRKAPTNPYCGSGFVMEEHEKRYEAPSSSRRVHWAHHADSDPGEASPVHSEATPHLEKPGQSTKTSRTVHFPRVINYALITLLFAVVLGLVLIYGEETDLLQDNFLVSSHFVLSLRRYARSSERPSPRLRRQVNAVVRDGFASQIGRRDYALAADGGIIVPRLTSGPGSMPGSPETHPAFVLLRDNLHGGRCWAIHGHQAQVSIRTPERIRFGSVTVDHVPREVADDPNQAPRRMRLWGAVDGRENMAEYARYLASTSPVFRDGPIITQGWTFLHLLDFEYDLFGANHVQTFSLDAPVRDLKMDFGVFVVEVLDNWGSEWTCIYRIRLHGTPL